MEYICSDCGKQFSTKKTLQVHSVIHDSSENFFEICHVTCIGKKAFLNHLKFHKTFECETCGKTIKYSSKPAHIKTCQSTVIHKCDLCVYETRYEHKLKSHMKIHVKPEKENTSHQCVQCGQQFPLKHNLTRHMKIHAKAVKEKDLFKCEVCGKEYSSKNSLGHHGNYLMKAWF